jgi:hypothetical protein
MSANAARTGRSIAWRERPWTAILLVFVIASIGLVVAGVLTKQVAMDHRPQLGSPPIVPDQVTMTDDRLAAVALPRSIVPTIAHTLAALLKELGKQAIDQPGHFLIAALPIVLSRHFTGVPWYGWAAVPLLAYREWLQWPSNRWWDPPLDWAVLALGVIVATWAIRSLPRLRRLPPSAPLHHTVPSAAHHAAH